LVGGLVVWWFGGLWGDECFLECGCQGVADSELMMNDRWTPVVRELGGCGEIAGAYFKH
jgi:hypothetical protein